MDLSALLHKTFGHASFRANQEAVCRAATDGRDVLLVMPTGAGKSLCYQLPAIARSGTALVISPLIALMDDQASKLSHLGLKTARIHSGLSRDEARQACRGYLDGNLQFLFIAPERMRVPGFPEMLAKRKPSLIAIDEAHCISAWGHDFRPDYRTLGDYLPSLRPAPVIALTATATPTVQKDIVAQLQLHQPSLFIHGFRRHNLAIEVVELSKPRRNEFTANLLKEKSNRPAIVYAPSRKAAEELASKLGGSAAAYHAGLDPGTRERVQRHFLNGKLEIVVATIAFGMGIDKADVRTVVHTALPGSVEAYYQEIGRAGRDGLPSRTVLLHSFADRKMHDFFLERDYPPPTELSRVAAVLTDDYQMPDLLRQRLRMDAETFDRAVEKLASQGAASINIEGNVRTTGSNNWRKGYDEQVAFRRSQIDRMMQFTESPQCRMSALIQHFGDVADGLRPCGHCDFCAPTESTAQTFRRPTAEEDRQLRTILRALDGASAKATGKLHTDLALGIDRKQFDAYLDALTRAGLIALTTDTFTNPEGNVINFKRASLTHEGRNRADSDTFDILLKDTAVSTASSQRKGLRETRGTKPSKASIKAQRDQTVASYTAAQRDLESRLREWRKAEAAKTGKPAFMVFADSVLNSIVLACPTTIPTLLQVSGIGPRITDTHGAAICALCRSEASPSAMYGRTVSKATIVRPSTNNGKRTAKDPTLPSRVMATKRRRLNEREELANRRRDFENDLRTFAAMQSLKLNQPAAKVLSEDAILEVIRLHPRSVEELRDLEHLRGDLPESFLHSLVAICVEEYKPEDTPTKAARPAQGVAGAGLIHEPLQTFTRQRPISSEPTTASLTPQQQALDQRLHAWRKSESENLGVPQFFVLASSTLRSIVLAQPQTISQLKAINGLNLEKIERFGPAIIEACTS